MTKYVHFSDLLEMLKSMSDNQLLELIAFIRIELRKRDQNEKKRKE